MASEKFKLLTGTLALKEFTIGELSDATGVRLNTVKSWLQRSHSKDEYVAPTSKKRKSPTGRPAQVWSLREGGEEQIRAALDVLGVPLEIGTREEAEAAFSDNDIRVLVKRHLLLASRERDREMRDEELAEARDWLEHEEARLSDWIARGFACPDSVCDEIDVLKDWIFGLELRADRLGFEEFGDNVLIMADWLASGIVGWFDAPVVAERTPFAPLELTYHGDFEPEEALVRQLLVVFRTAEHVETIPADRIIGAFLMVLPRLARGPAQAVVCEVLDRIGHDRIGSMLRKRMGNNHGSLREHRFVNHALAAFEVYPKLLQNDVIGAWFDALPTSRLWSPTFVVSYLFGVEHRPNAHMMRVIAIFKPELELLLERLGDPSDTSWLNETEGLNLDPDLVRERLQLLIGESIYWTGASQGLMRDYSQDWARFTASP